MSRRTNSYRDALVNLINKIDVHASENEVLLAHACEALDENGDGHLVVLETSEILQDNYPELAARLIFQRERYLAEVEAAKTPEQRATDKETREKYERHLIYKTLTKLMRICLICLLVNIRHNAASSTMQGLQGRGLLDDKMNLTALGRKIAEGCARNVPRKVKILRQTGVYPESKPRARIFRIVN